MVLMKRICLPLYTSIRHHQVTVLGGATDIGQTISLLLRIHPKITKLIVHDAQAATMGITMDLSHVPSNASIKSYVGEDTLKKSIDKSEIIIVADGLTRKPGITESLWLNSNRNFMRSVARGLAEITPMPFVGVVTEPLNVLVPMAAEIMKNHGKYEPKKLFGITVLDELRAQSLYAADYNIDPRKVFIPVIGGRSDKTCIPLLSQSKPCSDLDIYKVEEFTTKLRKADENTMKAKNGFSPVISVAYSAVLFTHHILNVLDGKKATVNALVENNDFGTEYFSGRVHVDLNGIIEMQRYSKFTDYEFNLLESSIAQLRKDVLQGKTCWNILDSF